MPYISMLLKVWSVRYSCTWEVPTERVQILELHPRDIWAFLQTDWDKTYAKLSLLSTPGSEDNNETPVDRSTPSRKSKRSSVDDQSDKENEEGFAAKRARIVPHVPFAPIPRQGTVDGDVRARFDKTFIKMLEVENDKFLDKLITEKGANQSLRDQLQRIAQSSVLHREADE